LEEEEEEEGEGVDDESREATLRHPSLGEGGQQGKSGAMGGKKVFILSVVAIRIATHEMTQHAGPIRRQRIEAIARRRRFSATWRCLFVIKAIGNIVNIHQTPSLCN